MPERNLRPRLTYSVGNEHNPANPFGRNELAIECDGAVRLEHHRFGQQRGWTGSVGRAVLDRLWTALDLAEFPNIAYQRLPADSTIRVLSAESGPIRETVHVAWHAAKDLPGYDEAFMILDAIVRELSEDTVRVTSALQPPFVTDIQCLP
jgi:hypothetical protein